MTTIDWDTVTEFRRDLRKLKYRHLEDDLKVIEKVLAVEPIGRDALEIPRLGPLTARVFKIKKFHSQDFQGRGCQSGFRLIYAYDVAKDKIFFIEIYHKNQQENHDAQRIKKYFKR
jgi:mRNA-degrading endonuclease RelE of RelBE toxin-antitoxin system